MEGYKAPRSPEVSDRFGQERNLEEVIKRHVLWVLDMNDGHKTNTAKQLGISLKTLYNKLECWGFHTREEQNEPDY